MRYPTISMDVCMKLSSSFLRDGQRPADTGEIDFAGTGPDLDVSSLAEASALCEEALTAWAADPAVATSDRDLLEGRLSGHIHQALHGFPVLVLDDPGFWRFAVLQYFWSLTYWRERERFDSRDPAKYLRYVDATQPTECVLTRMFLRAQVVRRGQDDYALAEAVPRGTDFWRSHVLRVGVSYAPSVAQAFAREQAQRRMATDELRQFASMLNRASTNIVFPVLDDAEAIAAVQSLRADGSISSPATGSEDR